VPAVDYERCWLVLKEHVLSKNSHGQRDLLSVMARAEIDSAVPEGQEGFDATPARSRPSDQRLRVAASDG
jgi:hypothetical protein